MTDTHNEDLQGNHILQSLSLERGVPFREEGAYQEGR